MRGDAVFWPRPVRLVVNTHYHSDHVGGNAHWRQVGAVVVAHERAYREYVGLKK